MNLTTYGARCEKHALNKSPLITGKTCGGTPMLYLFFSVALYGRTWRELNISEFLGLVKDTFHVFSSNRKDRE